jgi:hypothetical protein
MHLIVLACDLDGTLTDSGEVAADTWALLRRAKTAGLALLLVTGHILRSFTPGTAARTGSLWMRCRAFAQPIRKMPRMHCLTSCIVAV